MFAFARFDALSVPLIEDFDIAKTSVACAAASDIWLERGAAHVVDVVTRRW